MLDDVHGSSWRSRLARGCTRGDGQPVLRSPDVVRLDRGGLRGEACTTTHHTRPATRYVVHPLRRLGDDCQRTQAQAEALAHRVPDGSTVYVLPEGARFRMDQKGAE